MFVKSLQIGKSEKSDNTKNWYYIKTRTQILIESLQIDTTILDNYWARFY